MNTKQNVVAYEFLNEKTGHAIVDYTENTHVGQLTAGNGYTARPLVYADEAMVVSLLALDAKAVEALMTAIGSKAATQPTEVEKLMDAACLCRRCAAPLELQQNTERSGAERPTGAPSSVAPNQERNNE
jgi:hypothetical protein